MPIEGSAQDRLWLCFPKENDTLGLGGGPEAGYRVWAEVANLAARFEPVSVIVDPSERHRAARMLDAQIERVEAPIDDFWLRDSGASFVLADDGTLGAVDWVFTGWGAANPDAYARDNRIAALMAAHSGATPVPSLLANEGGGFHVDGDGTVLLTETVQLDPARNPHADHTRIEAELSRTIGARHFIWLPRGLEADYGPFGTKGHVDIVATMPRSGVVLLHAQRDRSHPDARLTQHLREHLSAQTNAHGTKLEVIDLPAPATLKVAGQWVDWSYVNHVVINNAVIACSFGEPAADARAAGILAEAYPGREVVTIDAREIFARGGGIHCITQQQPRRGGSAPRAARSARTEAEGDNSFLLMIA